MLVYKDETWSKPYPEISTYVDPVYPVPNSKIQRTLYLVTTIKYLIRYPGEYKVYE